MKQLTMNLIVLMIYLLMKNKFFMVNSQQTQAPIVWSNQTNQTLIIRVGIMIANKGTDYGLRRKNSAFGNSLGAINIAMERLWRENLIPANVNFTFVWKIERCVQSTAAGFTYQFIKDYDVDLIIASPCLNAPPVTGKLAAYFNVPVIIWGQMTPTAMDRNTTYKTSITTVPNFFDFSKTVCDVMNFYEWEQFAFIMQIDDGGACLPFSKQLDKVVNTRTDCYMSYKDEVVKNTYNSTDTAYTLMQIKQRARIVVLCFDDVLQLRLFALTLFDAGMVTSEYVYIIPDADLTISLDKNKMPFWSQDRGNMSFESKVDYDTSKKDGRDADAEAISQFTLYLYLNTTTTTSDRLNFSANILSKVYEWPFYCNNCLNAGDLPSIFAPFLYDAFFFYGLSLGNVLKNQTANSTQDYRNGTLIAMNAKGRFEGMTGTIRLAADGTRRANYILGNRVKTENGYKLQSYLQLNVTVGVAFSNITVQYEDPATTIWASRGGKQPLAIPKCGFDGNGCPVSAFEQFKAYIICGIALFGAIVFSSVSLIIYIIRGQINARRRQDQLWQISYLNLKKVKLPNRNSSTNERSVRSLGTINSSKFTLDSLIKSNSLYLYEYKQERCVGLKHPKVGTNISFGREDMVEYRNMLNLDHENINLFIGLSHDGPEILSLWKYCQRGSLKDVLTKDSMTKDAVFVYSIIRDLCEGLNYIHQSPIHCHGSIKSSNCLVDERWQIKISYFGLRTLKKTEKFEAKDLLWKAPELLRMADADGNNGILINGTQKGDIYSLALVLTEVINMSPCWEDSENVEELASTGNTRSPAIARRRTNLRVRNAVDEQRNERLRSRNAEEIVYMLKKGGIFPPRPKIRPVIENLSPAIPQLIRECWAENPEERPKVTQIRSIIRSNQVANVNLMDHVFSMLEEYALTLEKEVEERTRELVEEKKKSDLLLYRMLPQNIAERLKLGELVEPESYECVTVFFSDVVSFTQVASRLRPLQVVNLLNELYTNFDSIIAEHDVYKVETIGDGYLCVSGLPKRNGNEHAKEIADMALRFVGSTINFKIPDMPNERIKLRIGLHSGPCVAGIVGLSMPRYCLFGDTVNTASRMETSSLANKIHISKDTNYLLTLLGGYFAECRGEVIIKGKGVMQTFWLNGHVDYRLESHQTTSDGL